MPPPISRANIGSRITSEKMRRNPRRSGDGNSLKPSSFRRAAAVDAFRPGLVSFSFDKSCAMDFFSRWRIQAKDQNASGLALHDFPAVVGKDNLNAAVQLAI